MTKNIHKTACVNVGLNLIFNFFFKMNRPLYINSSTVILRTACSPNLSVHVLFNAVLEAILSDLYIGYYIFLLVSKISIQNANKNVL